MRELLSRYGGLVYSLVRRFCYEPGEFEDAVQEIFVALWKSAARFNEEMGSEETFVSMVARRRLIDRRRRVQRRIQPNADADVVQPAARPEPIGEGAENSEQSSRVLAALATLRPEQQQVLRLTILQGLSHDQVAKATGMPLGTVKTHARRGLMALREAIGAEPAKSRVGGVDGRTGRAEDADD
jgi:RNA polymerase sigma-70 factor (ECF subfamily)